MINNNIESCTLADPKFLEELLNLKDKLRNQKELHEYFNTLRKLIFTHRK